MTRDPWKTTRLIGRTCKGRDTFSEAVRMVDGFLVPSGLRRRDIPAKRYAHHFVVGAQHGSTRSLERCTDQLKDFKSRGCVRKGATTFVGDKRSGETPDPIPNSEVKPGPPMILLRGKVGHCRLFDPGRGNTIGVTLFLARPIKGARLVREQQALSGSRVTKPRADSDFPQQRWGLAGDEHNGTLRRPFCSGDAALDRAVDNADLLAAVDVWGQSGCSEDLDWCGHVDSGDVLEVGGGYGDCQIRG